MLTNGYIYYIVVQIFDTQGSGRNNDAPMTKQKNLGEFEILVLGALVRLGENAYGVTIRNEIEKRAERQVSVGALYSTLSRLEEKKYVSSDVRGATAERGGRAKRYYELSALGQERLEKSMRALKNMFADVKPSAAAMTGA